MKIAVCVPSGDLIHADFTFSLMAMLTYVVRERRDIHCLCINEKGSLLEINRHRLVILALGLKAEYCLFLDSDMTFSYDTLTRLVDSGKDIIGLNAIMRCAPYTPCARNLDDSPVGYDQTDTQEVKKIGTGILLVRTKVFEAIGMPYFKVEYKDEKWSGEDFNFCERARAAGFKIYCHNELSKNVKHLGIKSYGYEKERINDL